MTSILLVIGRIDSIQFQVTKFNSNSISKKRKLFSHFFVVAHLKSASNVEHFEEKDDPHRLCTF